MEPPTIAVLGASGLIGEAVASALVRDGFRVVAIARKFSASKTAQADWTRVECPIVALAPDAIAKIFSDHRVDIVVNCIGILQGTPFARADSVHGAFVERLREAIAASERPILLVHLSIPGDTSADQTEFSRTKRDAEHAIRTGTAPFVILRPGFVIAPAAYGGSALVRALAALPFDLPERESQAPFATSDIRDLAATIASVAREWHAGRRDWRVVWDAMAPQKTKVGETIAAFRRRFGGPARSVRIPSWLLGLGAITGDAVALLGWRPPIRSTALAEMRRGVRGDPAAWIAETGIAPIALHASVDELPASIQEKWFARLYLAKALVLGVLALFWIASGLIALTLSFGAAVRMTASAGLSPSMSALATVATALADIAIGMAIAVRPTSRFGLLAGIALSLLYLFIATTLVPAMWADPLGPLLKVLPAIVLMLVALAVLDNR